MELYKNYLQLSTDVFSQLEKFPEEEERELFIEEVTKKLDQLEIVAEELKQSGFEYDSSKREHEVLYELDKGIRDRLNKLFNIIKSDMKDLQNAKRNEAQYANPYGHVQSMDGMYYDKKK